MVAPQLVLACGLFAAAGFLAYFFLSGLIWGAGYGPTPKRQLEAAAALLQLKEGDTVYDLGSGFGRALIFFARQYHVSAVGVEIDPLHCFFTKRSVRRQGVSANVGVLRGNLLDFDLEQSSKVFFFLTPLLMKRLQDKVAREMPEGGRVVSVDHRFPDWKPSQSVHNVHLYVVGRRPELTRPFERTGRRGLTEGPHLEKRAEAVRIPPAGLPALGRPDGCSLES